MAARWTCYQGARQMRLWFSRPGPPALQARCVRAYVTRDAGVDPRSLTADGTLPEWDIRMLYDGDCPLCMKEVNFLRRKDSGSGRIDFVDIAAPDYDAGRNAGIDFETAMGEIHAILPDGSIVTKVEVFRRLYDAVGLGWLYAFTKNPTVGRAADAVYDVWARYRLPLTGRPDFAEVLESRRREGKSCKEARREQVAAADKSKG